MEIITNYLPATITSIIFDYLPVKSQSEILIKKLPFKRPLDSFSPATNTITFHDYQKEINVNLSSCEYYNTASVYHLENLPKNSGCHLMLVVNVDPDDQGISLRIINAINVRPALENYMRNPFIFRYALNTENVCTLNYRKHQLACYKSTFKLKGNDDEKLIQRCKNWLKNNMKGVFLSHRLNNNGTNFSPFIQRVNSVLGKLAYTMVKFDRTL